MMPDRASETAEKPPMEDEAFASGDYEAVNERFFAETLRDRSWSALPAGWFNPYSVGAEGFSARSPAAADLLRYSLDEGRALGELKSSVTRLVSAWEGRTLEPDELTVCPSVSTANLVVMFALRERGISTIIFEAPAYYATYDQAKLLGFRVMRIPALRAEDFEAPLEAYERQLVPAGPCAVWLTQPRYGIGTNQSLSRIRNLAKRVGPANVLVVDEAAEQQIPSVLADIDHCSSPVIRTRGLLKGTGLNGLRISVVLHPADWRASMEKAIEPAGASLDRFSLENTAALADKPMLLPAMLRAANAQVVGFRKGVEMMALDTWLQPTPLENGYIGTLMLDFTRLPGGYNEKRAALLAQCQAMRLPVMLRSSIGFPFEPTWEGIRINYFTPEANVRASVETLISALPDVQARLAR